MKRWIVWFLWYREYVSFRRYKIYGAPSHLLIEKIWGRSPRRREV